MGRYITVAEVNKRLVGLVSTGQNFEYNATHGVSSTDSLLEDYINQSEALVLRELSTLYKVPLSKILKDAQGNITGYSEDINDFSDIAKYAIKHICLYRTLIMFLKTVYGQQGNSSTHREHLNNMEEEYEKNLNLTLEMQRQGGKANGKIYPALSELELSNMYITRQDNQIPTVKNTSNMSTYSLIKEIRKI